MTQAYDTLKLGYAPRTRALVILALGLAACAAVLASCAMSGACGSRILRMDLSAESAALIKWLFAAFFAGLVALILASLVHARRRPRHVILTAEALEVETLFPRAVRYADIARLKRHNPRGATIGMVQMPEAVRIYPRKGWDFSIVRAGFRKHSDFDTFVQVLTNRSNLPLS